ncbi:MAG: heavy-metal-associated domain-containing protein [Salinibacter sp.]
MPATDVQFRVPDMHCEGCANRITNVLERLEGVRSTEVSLEDKTAEVEVEDGAVDPEDLKVAVEKAGYTVES